MEYRNLTDAEISLLEKNGCVAEDWSRIQVKPEFDPRRLHQVYFAGDVIIGLFLGEIEVEKGVRKPSGIYRSYIKDCIIGDGVYIASVSNMISYHVAPGVAIENVNTLITEGESTFGNGIELEVLNEGGGRDLPIFDKMSAQMAHLMVHYRHDRKLIENLGKIIREYADAKKSDKGIIGEGARIIGTRIIRNVNIGSYAEIYGAVHLEEGTISSCEEAPVMIGPGVTAKEFMVLSGSKVDSDAILEKTFIGQSVKAGKQFSAENSVVFANSEVFHSEAVSVFGGPYTISHHKSTLLIAAQYSFYNAGSGSNKSNHLYKLGPVHQGILERGSKTGSFSYMMWPCHLGPFSVVLGKHKTNFDTSDLPFSYIDAKSDRSELIPALNLFTVGTLRDTRKWPERDKRKDPEKLDLIHFDLFSPFIVQKMVNASKILQKLKDNASRDQKYVPYKGLHIPRLMLRTAQKYYEIGIKVYMGSELVKFLESSKANGFEELKKEFIQGNEKGKGKWMDLSGMFAPQEEVNSICKGIKEGTVTSVDDLLAELRKIYDNYPAYTRAWCRDLIAERLGVDLQELTKDHLVGIINDWKTNAEKMNNMIIKDAQGEFSESSKIGFGLDGDQEARDQDFEAVRGRFEDNSFVQGLRKETEEIGKKAEALIQKLQEI